MVARRFPLTALKGGDGASDRFRLTEYFTEVTLLRDSRLLDKTIDEVEHDPRYELKVMGLMRRGRRVGRDLGRERLGEGDVLLVRTSPYQLVNFREVDLREGVEGTASTGKIFPISRPEVVSATTVIRRSTWKA